MSDLRERQVVPVCPKCNSDNVVADAVARWNIESQEWEVANVFDQGHSCDDCGAEDIEFAWVEKEVQGSLDAAVQEAEATMNVDLDQLHDFVVAHGFGSPTQAGYELGKQLITEGDDYATAAAEIVARGMTEDPVQD